MMIASDLGVRHSTINSLVGGWSNGGSMFGALLCLLTLPLCLLDKDASETLASISDRELLANGFSSQEVEQIRFDRAAVARSLRERGIEIRPSQNPQENSFASLERIVREIHPTASTAYLGLLRERHGAIDR